MLLFIYHKNEQGHTKRHPLGHPGTNTFFSACSVYQCPTTYLREQLVFCLLVSWQKNPEVIKTWLQFMVLWVSCFSPLEEVFPCWEIEAWNLYNPEPQEKKITHFPNMLLGFNESGATPASTSIPKLSVRDTALYKICWLKLFYWIFKDSASYPGIYFKLVLILCLMLAVFRLWDRWYDQ